MKLRHLLTSAAVALVATVIYLNYGDIKRYIKISSM